MEDQINYFSVNEYKIKQPKNTNQMKPQEVGRVWMQVGYKFHAWFQLQPLQLFHRVREERFRRTRPFCSRLRGCVNIQVVNVSKTIDALCASIGRNSSIDWTREGKLKGFPSNVQALENHITN